MLLKPEEKNILTGLLGTVAFHLLIIIAFLLVRLDKVHNVHREPLTIEIDETTFKSMEEILEQMKLIESNVEPLSREQLSNIAVNTANRLEQKISTEKYINDLKEELNIKDPEPIPEKTQGSEPVLQDEKKEEVKKEITKKNEFHKGPTRINYFLEGRVHRYMHIPVYKCQGSGKVVVDIIVNPEGEVISASVSTSNTSEECIIRTALESARISTFNIDLKAVPRQKGSISYEFVAQ